VADGDLTDGDRITEPRRRLDRKAEIPSPDEETMRHTNEDGSASLALPSAAAE
jgi:hypothetical protein